MLHNQGEQQIECGLFHKEEKKKGAERMCGGIIAENFPNLLKDMNVNIQLRWTQRNPHWDAL